MLVITNFGKHTGEQLEPAQLKMNLFWLAKEIQTLESRRHSILFYTLLKAPYYAFHISKQYRWKEVSVG